jgi:matrixin/dockerin type I repeat protein
VFDDPFDEIDDPVDCRGVLGIGGYCYADESRTVGGQEYKRIRVGKATIANGWDGCPQWTPCNLAQIATHELGHTIGLGHSLDESATMAGTAHFDGRCAGLAADDIAGVRAIYPAADTPTPTPTSPPPPSATVTETPTETATARPPTPTASPFGARGVRGRITYYGSGLPVPDVRVLLRGAGSTVAVTQSGGDYSVDELAAGDWTVEPQRDGNLAGGGVTALDAAMVLQASAGALALDAEHRVACDVTGNGSVSPLDAARILQVVVGDLTTFPAAALCGSDFVFFPSPSPAANQERIEPALDFAGCRAGALSYAPLLEQVAGQNFRAALIGDCSGNWQPTDARGAEPMLAPEGTALAVGPLRRLPGGRWRLAIGLRTPATASALEIELRYDSARLTPGLARTAHLGEAALIDAVGTQPGRLRLALASAIPLPADGRALAVVDFTSIGAGAVSARSVRPWSASLDDRLVTVPR